MPWKDSPTLATLSEELRKYKAALRISIRGSILDKGIKNQQREILTDLLKQLAHYINYTSKGDRMAILSSGFELNKETKTKIALEPVKQIKVRTGASPGEIEIQVKVKGAKSLVYQYTNDLSMPENKWIATGCSKRKCILQDVPRYEKLWFRAVAIGSQGQIVHSETVIGVAL